jgi:hypothetical protein
MGNNNGDSLNFSEWDGTESCVREKVEHQSVQVFAHSLVQYLNTHRSRSTARNLLLPRLCGATEHL